MMRAPFIAASLLFAAPVAAQTVEPCDWRASAAAIAEPWQDNTRTFSKGAVRLALLDTIEPAAGAFHVLVLSPPYSELGDRQCRVVSFDGGMGFGNLTFSALEAGYDPAIGLMFSLPGTIFLPEDAFQNSVMLRFTLNQATGAIDARIDLGPE